MLPLLGNAPQSLALHQMQQFKGGAGGSLMADFPFLHGGHTGVQQRGEYRLADAGGFADLLDFLRLQGLDGRQAEPVKLSHRDLVHHASGIKPLGRFVDGFKNR